MSVRDWFAAKKKTRQMDATVANSRLSDDDFNRLWSQCFNCNAQLTQKALKNHDMVCPECGYHFRIGAWDRLQQLLSHPGDRFVEMDADLIPADPLAFSDTKAYQLRQKEAHHQTGLNEAIITGLAEMGGERLAIGVMDFTYLGGSMGSVVGEKITRLIEAAIEARLPVVIFSSSGGARMQEGTFSLMQMVKTGSALANLHDAGLLFISVLTEPTFGGVTASFGTLGDIIIAEEGARIGFAGRRVIEQTIRQKLPADFQTAGYLMKYGQVDRVTHRHHMRQELLSLLQLHRKASGLEPQANIPLFKKAAELLPV